MSKNIGSSVYRGINCCCSTNLLNEAPTTDGITVPGSESNQKFTTGSIKTLENEVHVITLMLRGKTIKEEIVVTPVVITKMKCPSCGTPNGSFSKFCSECGTGVQVF